MHATYSASWLAFLGASGRQSCYCAGASSYAETVKTEPGSFAMLERDCYPTSRYCLLELYPRPYREPYPFLCRFSESVEQYLIWIRTSGAVLLGHETVLVGLLRLLDEVLLVLVLGVGGLDVLLHLQCPAVENTVSDTTDEGRIADDLCASTKSYRRMQGYGRSAMQGSSRPEWCVE